jgi:hypothetical protein
MEFELSILSKIGVYSITFIVSIYLNVMEFENRIEDVIIKEKIKRI